MIRIFQWREVEVAVGILVIEGTLGKEMAEWRELMSKLECVILTKEVDILIWKLVTLGKFTTRGMYRY